MALIAAGLLAAFLVVRRRRLGRPVRAAGAAAAAGLLLFGTGVISPPALEPLLREAGQTLGALTYVLVGALVFLETGAFVGFVVPGETAILVGGLVAAQGEIGLLALIAVVWACALAGDLVSFAVGRRLGREFLLRHGAPVGITAPRVDRVEGFFARHGGKTVLLGRNIGFVRPVMPFLAGSSGMPLRRFVAYDVIGVAVWGAYNALLGYIFWRSIDLVTTWASRGALAGASLIVLVAVAVVAVRFLRVPANRARARRRLRGLLDRRPAPRARRHGVRP
jgi:membrane protein DedA with SNARE-associated domain